MASCRSHAHWTGVAHPIMPVPTNLVPVSTAFAWFNSPATHATTPLGTQTAATCGLHAFNHAMVPIRIAQHLPPMISSRHHFESTAMACNHGDAPEHLIEPTSGNYDVAVLVANFTAAGAAAIPMAPADVETRLGDVFSDHETAEGVYHTGAYLIRTPCGGGHWLCILNGATISGNSPIDVPALLCDSLYTTPHSMTLAQVEDLITVCAFEHAQRSSIQDFCPWHCFLVGIPVGR